MFKTILCLLVVSHAAQAHRGFYNTRYAPSLNFDLDDMFTSFLQPKRTFHRQHLLPGNNRHFGRQQGLTQQWIQRDSFGNISKREDCKGWTVSVQFPGARPKDVKVFVDKGVMTVAASVRTRRSEGRSHETLKRTFEKTFKVPNNVKDEKIEAQFVDQTLRIRLPRQPPRRATSPKGKLRNIVKAVIDSKPAVVAKNETGNTTEPAVPESESAAVATNVEESGSGRKVRVGSKVSVNYRNSGNYYPGKIHRAWSDGTFDIAYDDGDAERRVKLGNIKVLDTSDNSDEVDEGEERIEPDSTIIVDEIADAFETLADALSHSRLDEIMEGAAAEVVASLKPLFDAHSSDTLAPAEDDQKDEAEKEVADESAPEDVPVLNHDKDENDEKEVDQDMEEDIDQEPAEEKDSKPTPPEDEDPTDSIDVWGVERVNKTTAKDKTGDSEAEKEEKVRNTFGEGEGEGEGEVIQVQ